MIISISATDNHKIRFLSLDCMLKIVIQRFIFSLFVLWENISSSFSLQFINVKTLVNVFHGSDCLIIHRTVGRADIVDLDRVSIKGTCYSGSIKRESLIWNNLKRWRFVWLTPVLLRDTCLHSSMFLVSNRAVIKAFLVSFEFFFDFQSSCTWGWSWMPPGSKTNKLREFILQDFFEFFNLLYWVQLILIPYLTVQRYLNISRALNHPPMSENL